MRIARSLTAIAGAALALSCATALWSTAHATQQGSATVRAVPPSSDVSMSGKTFDVKIDVANVSNLAGFQFVLVVDSSVLKPTGALKTAFLGQTGREIYCPDPTIEDAALRFACVTLREQPAGVDGSGTVATVSLKTIAKGTSTIELKEVKLVHPDGTEITSTTQNAQLTVTGGGGWWTTMHILLVAGAAVLAAVVVIAGVMLLMRLQARRPAPSDGDTAV